MVNTPEPVMENVLLQKWHLYESVNLSRVADSGEVDRFWGREKKLLSMKLEEMKFSLLISELLKRTSNPS